MAKYVFVGGPCNGERHSLVSALPRVELSPRRSIAPVLTRGPSPTTQPGHPRHFYTPRTLHGGSGYYLTFYADEDMTDAEAIASLIEGYRHG